MAQLSDYDDIDLDTCCPMTEEEVKRVQEKIKLLGAALPRPAMPTVRRRPLARAHWPWTVRRMSLTLARIGPHIRARHIYPG
jgi:hypothetical protein